MTDLVVSPQLQWKRPESAALTALEASRNCSCAGGSGEANWSLAMHPGHKPISHHEFRLASGNPRDGSGRPIGLSSSQHLTALRRLGVVGAERHFAEPYSLAADALRAGLVVGMAINYRTINAMYNGRYSGQRTFNGGHWLAVQGWTPRDRRVGFRNSTTSHDSLYDGRTKTWGTAPLGPQTVPWLLLRRAMEDFEITVNGVRRPIGAGLGVFIIVRPTPWVEPEPEPIPEPLPEPLPEPEPSPEPVPGPGPDPSAPGGV